MPGELGEHARLDAVFRIGAAIEVLREKLLALGVLEEIVEQHIELLRRQLAVLFPPDRLFGGVVADDELVFRRAAGVDAGLGAERAALDDVAFLGGNGVFVKLLGGRFQWTPARSFRPNLSAPWAPFRRPVSFTQDLRQRIRLDGQAAGRWLTPKGRSGSRPRPGPIMPILTHAKAPWRHKAAGR